VACYSPALVLVVWALLIAAGVPRGPLLSIAGLIAEAVALAVYVHATRQRLRGHHHHHDDGF
jgi:hypothetical protein